MREDAHDPEVLIQHYLEDCLTEAEAAALLEGFFGVVICITSEISVYFVRPKVVENPFSSLSSRCTLFVCCSAK